MPFVIYVLGFSVFCMNTTEVMISGLLPALSHQFAVSVPTVGYLVSVYALGMAIGGPVMTVASLRLPRKTALVSLMSVFILGQALGALSTDYWVMFAARLITAFAAGAFFGTGASVCVAITGTQLRARGLSIMFGGLMVAQVVGLPAATLAEQHLGWRASFWGVDILSVICLAALTVCVPRIETAGHLDLRAELGAFRNGRLWVAYATNALSVGAVFATFSYLSPILTNLAGFSAAVVPLLFVGYGLATIVGNILVGRFADRFSVQILLYGQAALVAVLIFFALEAHIQATAVTALVMLGLVGLPLSAARGARIMAVSNNRPLVSTMATAMVNVGIIIGPWLGGTGIAEGSYTAPMWIGAGLGALSLATVIPAALERRRSQEGSQRHEVMT